VGSVGGRGVGWGVWEKEGWGMRISDEKEIGIGKPKGIELKSGKREKTGVWGVCG